MSQQINLYRPIFRKQEKKFSARAMLQAGAAIAGGVVVIYGLLAWQVAALREDARQVERQLAASQKRLQDVTQKLGPGAKSQLLADEVTRLEKQVAARLRVQEILRQGIFTNARGYSDFLEAFARQHVPGVWLTGFDITGAGENLRLSGRTTDPAKVPRYVQRLSGEQALTGKEFQVFVLSRPDKKNGAENGAYVDFIFRTSVPAQGGRS